MFKRPHHQKIAALLASMNVAFLLETKCYFGGGTAIALLLGEYRESVDLDFMCSDLEGYRKLRNSVFDNGLDELFRGGVETLRDIRADRDGVRTILVAEGTPIKLEILQEARLNLEDGQNARELPVPCLARVDMFAEKLLANVDRFGDKSVMSRDVIDLLVMERHWGPVPNAAWSKAESAYGNSVHVALRKAKDLLRADHQYLDGCLKAMGIDNRIGAQIRTALGLPRSRSHDVGR